MKTLFIMLCLAIMSSALADDHCRIFNKVSENGDSCPNFGISYEGQRIGPGSSSGCFRTIEAAKQAKKEMRFCNRPLVRGNCQILLKGEKSWDNRSCPNFGVAIDGYLSDCHRTIESAQNDMLAEGQCVR